MTEAGIADQGSSIPAELSGGRTWTRLVGPAVILVAALVAIAPQIFQGDSCGHDFDFHLVSWLDAQQSWREGILYPRWSPSANFGAGEPRFIFYPPLSWMLGAALGFVMRWASVPIAMVYLCLAGAGLATRALARQALSEGPATLAGCAALFSGYALFTAYERSDFGELMGGFWIPLLLLLILRDRQPHAHGWNRAFDGSAALLGLVVAGAWLSNAPLGVMASYLLAAMALMLAGLRRSGAPLVRASAAMLLGLGLASFYLVPATVEQRWVDIGQAIDDPGYQVENNWLFARHADPSMALHDLELLKASAIATTMLAVAVSGALVCWARHRFRGKSRWWIALAAIPLGVLLLQFPVSHPLWNLLPKMRYLQFPWRWLVVLEAPMGIFFAGSLWVSRKRWRVAVIAACVAIFGVATAFAGFTFFQVCDDDDAVAGMLSVYRAGTGFEGTDEYAPLGADDSLVATGLPEACLAASAATALGQSSDGEAPAWSPDEHSCAQTFATSPEREPSAEHLRVDADLPYDGSLILRLRRYPAWRVRVNGSPVADLLQRADGLIAVPVSAGHDRVTVDWTTTRDVQVGWRMSAAALGLLVGLGWFERRHVDPRIGWVGKPLSQRNSSADREAFRRDTDRFPNPRQ
ncbi:MAG: 6-pyruvoyl-tetrahydropterin synthase-related protein [Terracidiphilus sp.]